MTSFHFECYIILFFFNDTATTEIYTLSLHDALPISSRSPRPSSWPGPSSSRCRSSCCSSPASGCSPRASPRRSEEHTSELQSRQYLVCRLLLEKKKKKITNTTNTSMYNTCIRSNTNK